MNPIVRAMRANIARRDNWAQIRIGACALLLPPLMLGAALYSMLTTPDEGAARPAGAAAKAQLVRPGLLRDALPARAVWEEDPQPAAQGQATANPDQPAPEQGVAARPAPAEASMALLPRPLAPPGKGSPEVPSTAARAPAAHAPSAPVLPSAQGSAAAPPAAHRHARGEAARRNAQQSQHATSWRDWFEQLGIVPRNTRG